MTKSVLLNLAVVAMAAIMSLAPLAATASPRSEAVFAVEETRADVVTAETLHTAAQADVAAATAAMAAPTATLLTAQGQHAAVTTAIAATAAAGITDPAVTGPMQAALDSHQAAIDVATARLTALTPAATNAQAALVTARAAVATAVAAHEAAFDVYAGLLNAGFAAQIAQEQATQDDAIAAASEAATDAMNKALAAEATANRALALAQLNADHIKLNTAFIIQECPAMKKKYSITCNPVIAAADAIKNAAD